MTYFFRFMIAFCVCGFIATIWGCNRDMAILEKRAKRCAEIKGHRVSGKYNSALCRVNGRIVDVSYPDYREQAKGNTP